MNAPLLLACVAALVEGIGVRGRGGRDSLHQHTKHTTEIIQDPDLTIHLVTLGQKEAPENIPKITSPLPSTATTPITTPNQPSAPSPRPNPLHQSHHAGYLIIAI